MKRILSFLLILSMVSLSCASAQTYGSLKGWTKIDLNVTIINTADYSKFIIVNPNYGFRILRFGNESGGKLNNATGFWIMPYETLKINFQMAENSTYPVSVPSCGENELICGAVYPPLINYPKIQSFASLFPFMDRDLEILEVEGLVTFKVMNPSNNSVFFSVAPPVIFNGARTYDYYPNYTMKYSEYAGDFIWRFRGIEPPRKEKTEEPSPGGNLFRVTSTLLSGVKIPKLGNHPRMAPKFDFPIWIVFMRREITVTYRVSWTNSGR